MEGLCYVATLIISVALVIYGFMLILQRQQNENDIQVIQRQLRGFAYLILSQVILILGIAVCSGFSVGSVRKFIESARP